MYSLLPEELGAWQWLGGTNAGFVTQETNQSGAQSLALTFPENYAVQNFAAVTDMTYILTGWALTPTNAPLAGGAGLHLAVGLIFQDGTNAVSSFFGTQFTTNDPPGTWVAVGVTARAPRHVHSGTVTGWVYLAIRGPTVNYSGAIFVDSLCVSATNVPVTNTQSGALWNPGFEYTAAGTRLESMDNWAGFGNAGAIDGTRARSGNNSLMIYYTETLAGQSWPATSGSKYATAAYLASPSNDPFRTTGGARGVVILQYLDAASNVTMSYLSEDFTPASGTNIWLYREARGVAPTGTVSGRTLLGIIGSAGVYGGVVLFDDASQWKISTPTTNGLLVNGSFDDGIDGIIYDLDANGQLPGWKSLGGGSGYITTHAFDGEHSFVATYTEQLLEQRFDAVTGATYRVDGYMVATISSQDWAQVGAFGVILLEFFEGTNQITFASRPFRGTAPYTPWDRISVMGTAPSSGSITGRVLVGLIGSVSNYGITYFDAFSMSNVPPIAEYDLWKFNSFGDTNIVNGGPTDDYDGDGISNGDELIAGTDAASTNSVFVASSTSVSMNGLYVVEWPSVKGRIYSLSRVTDLLSGIESNIATGIDATPPANTYEDTSPTPSSFYKIRVQKP